jgi:hypothetical protein
MVTPLYFHPFFGSCPPNIYEDYDPLNALWQGHHVMLLEKDKKISFYLPGHLAFIRNHFGKNKLDDYHFFLHSALAEKLFRARYDFFQKSLNENETLRELWERQKPSSCFEEITLRLLGNLNQSKDKSGTEHHRQFIHCIRSCINYSHKNSLNTKDAKLYFFVRALASFGFLKQNVYHEGLRFLRRHVDYKEPLIEKKQNKENHLLDIFSHYSEKIGLSFSRSHWGVQYDLHLNGNHPFQTFELEIAGKKIQGIRFPISTYKVKDQVEVIPEFKAFMEQYKEEGKTHLYINYVHRFDRSQNYREYDPKVIALEHFDRASDRELYLISLDKNSLFFYQIEEHALDCSAENFMRQFKALLFSERSPFYFSEKIYKLVDKESFQENLKGLIDLVHKMYFYKKPKLLLEERRAFIELAYNHFTEYFLGLVKPDSFNLNCKNTIDRGPGGISSFYIYALLRSGKKINDDEINKIKFLTYLPAILVHNRTLGLSRVSRLRACAEQLFNQARNIENLKNALNPGIKPSDQIT